MSCFFYLYNVIFACLYAFRLFTFFILSNMVILSCLFWLKLQVTPDFPCSQKIWEAQKYKEKDVDYLSSIEVTCLICHFQEYAFILALSLQKKKKKKTLVEFPRLLIYSICKCAGSNSRSCRCHRNASMWCSQLYYLKYISCSSYGAQC